LNITVYVLFLLLQVLGAVILGFGIWILADKTSFIVVLQRSSPSLQTGAYILIGVGALTMLMGFLGCLGAVNEIRCLLGLYFTCLMIILLTQIAAALVIYFQKEKLRDELSDIVVGLIKKYDPSDEDKRSLQDAWDYVQTQIACCGWTGAKEWENNEILRNKSYTEYPCSCSNRSKDLVEGGGFCSLDDPVNGTATYADWPVHEQGCMDGVEQWLKDNVGIILGVCTGVAVIELLGMILSISLCKNIHSEDYTKVPKS
ncbi:CD82 protein, partial [Melanocharis versteri]|nr:CD82 protein [Melanocharis versteri]